MKNEEFATALRYTALQHITIKNRKKYETDI